MTDFASFLDACVRAGGIFGSLCAIVIVPALIWLGCRALSVPIRSMSDDPEWQAPLAAAAAALPGAIFLLISSVSIVRGFVSMCWQLPAGRAILGTIVALTIFAIVRAVWMALVRGRQLRELIGRAVAPSERLERIAGECGLRVRELPVAAPVCALAGGKTPVVLVSRGALTVLSDAELSAALRHERAHATRVDHLLGAAVAFFADLLPLPSRDLEETYKTAREFAADRAATRKADATDLASALVAMVKGTHAIATATPLVGTAKSTIATRVRSLLFGPPKISKFTGPRRMAIVALVSMLFIAGATTTVVASQPASCALPLQSGSR